jgi:hypothetical protein
MTLVRRFVVLIALMFWQGGFTFYSAVVVPIGQDMFGRKQGFLTRGVTDYLNLSGAIALVLLAWDVAVVRAPVSRRAARWLAWLVMAAGLAALVWLHPHMDRYLDLEELRIVDRRGFRYEHRWYLWISTGQWSAGLVFTLLTLLAWRREDVLSAALADTPNHPSPDRAAPP